MQQRKVSKYMEKEYEYVNHPSHYCKEGKKECIVLMEFLFGRYWTAIFCILSAFKYKYRAGSKPNESNERDKGKIDWYLKRANGYIGYLRKRQDKKIMRAINIVRESEW